jgi:hypothetical protein
MRSVPESALISYLSILIVSHAHDKIYARGSNQYTQNTLEERIKKREPSDDCLAWAEERGSHTRTQVRSFQRI